MIFVILARVLVLCLIVVAFTFIVERVYTLFFRKHLIDEEVEDIIDEASHDRIIKEAEKVADKIKNEELEDADAESGV